MHAGNEKGFVPNAPLMFSGNNKQEDYHSEMNKSKIAEIKIWLTENNIPFEENLRKPMN